MGPFSAPLPSLRWGPFQSLTTLCVGSPVFRGINFVDSGLSPENSSTFFFASFATLRDKNSFPFLWVPLPGSATLARDYLLFRLRLRRAGKYLFTFSPHKREGSVRYSPSSSGDGRVRGELRQIEFLSRLRRGLSQELRRLYFAA
jgi:hypothetical protein